VVTESHKKLYRLLPWPKIVPFSSYLQANSTVTLKPGLKVTERDTSL